MNLALAFALSVSAACLATNVTSASSTNSDTASTTIEAPNTSHLRPRSTGPNVGTSLDEVSSSSGASEVHKVDKEKMMMRSDHEHMIVSNISHPTRRDTAADPWTPMGPDFIGEDGETLGWGTALAKGGERFAIGSPEDYGIGKVQVFDTSSNDHQQVGSDIVVPDKSPYSLGFSVAMSEDGTHLIAGGGGFVAMFRYSEDHNDWVPLGSNSVIDIPSASNFGTVDMTKDGKRIAISNPRINNLVGEVKIFDYTCDVVICSWNEVVVLHGVFPGETFGSSLSMSDNGVKIVIGSSHESSAIEEDFVRVFEETASGWSQVGEDLDVYGLVTFMGGVSMAGNGKRFTVFTYRAGVQVYAITDSGKLEPDGELLPCYSNYATSTAKLSEDGDRVAATCNDGVIIYDRDTSTFVWEHVGSIPNSPWHAVGLSLSRNRMVVGLSDSSYGSRQGVASLWRSPDRKKCANSPLQFQVKTVGGSDLPFSCKWAAQNKDKFKCSTTGGQVATHCPKICGMCSEYGCSDSEGVFFMENGKERECAWLQSMSEDKRMKQCKKSSVAKTCRATCKFCE